VAEAKDAFLEWLKALLPQVRDSISKTQARYKEDYDKKVLPRLLSVVSGAGAHLRSLTRKHKRDAKVTGPYEVLQTEGRTYLIVQDGLPYRISGDHVEPAGPVDPRTAAGDLKWWSQTRSNLVGPSLCSSGSWTTPGMRRGSCGSWSAGLGMDLTTIPGNTQGACRWQRHTGTVAARGFSRRTQVRRSRVGTPRSRDYTANRQKSLVYASTMSPDSSLAKGPGSTPANTKHTHAP